MEAMRESWTDARLDDFAAHTDRRFDQVDRRFDSLERRMENGFAEINARFDSLQRTLFQLGGGVIVALIGLIATQL
jgi:tetrahydromethanopterin S-methyltransferase subunit G